MESKEGEGQYIRRGMNGGGEDEKGAGRRERETGIFPPKLDRQEAVPPLFYLSPPQRT